jgi:hypothetical protein
VRKRIGDVVGKVPVTWITRAATGVGGFHKASGPNASRRRSLGLIQWTRWVEPKGPDRLGAMGSRLGVLSF